MATFNSTDFLVSGDFNSTVNSLVQGKVFNWISDINISFLLSMASPADDRKTRVNLLSRCCGVSELYSNLDLLPAASGYLVFSMQLGFALVSPSVEDVLDIVWDQYTLAHI